MSADAQATLPARSQKTYAAFVSYSRKDEAVTTALRYNLQRFGKRWFELRALRVFLDSAGVRAGEPVWDELHAAMEASGFFLLVASPYSASSKWVNDEIAYWLTDNPVNTVLIVHVGGKIRWDDDAGDFDAGSDAVPEVLRGRFQRLPSIVVIPDADPTSSLFRDGVAILAARLHGERKEDLYDREFDEHRKLRRLQRWAIGILATLLALTLAGGSAALLQRDAARAQARLALSRDLAAQSAAWVSKNIDLGMLLAAQAYRTDDTVQARSALLNALMANPSLESTLRAPGSSAELSPTGNDVAVPGRSGVTVWNVATERRVGRPFGTEKRGEHPPPTTYPPLYKGAFSPDDGQLAVYTPTGDLEVWDLATHRLIDSARDPARDFSAPSEPGLIFSPGGRFIVSTGWHGAYVFDASTLRLVAGPLPIPGPTPGIGPAAFSPNGQLLVLSGAPPAVVIYDTATWRPAGTLATALPTADLAFSPDGRQLAVLSAFSVQLYNVHLAGQHLSLAGPVRTMSGPLNQYAVAWNSSGSLLATGGDDGTIIWRPETGKVVTTLRIHPAGSRLDGVNGLAFDASGDHLISSGADGVVTWQLNRTELTATERAEPGATAAIYAPAFGPGGRLLATADGARGALLWSVTSAAPASKDVGLPGGSTGGVAFGPEGRELVIGEQGDVAVWDLQDRRRLGAAMTNIYSAPTDGISPEIDDVAVSANGRYVAAAEYWGFTVWDLRTRHVALQVQMPEDEPNDNVVQLAFSPDGSTLAIPVGNNVELWSIARRHIAAVIPVGSPVNSAAFAPDGQFLAINTAQSATRLWGLQDRRWITAPMSDGPVSAVGAHQNPVAVSADSSMVASASGGEDTVTLWDAATGTQIGVLPSPNPASTSNTISGLAFSPSGQTLAVTTTAGTLSLWNLDPQRWVGMACDIAGRDLTPAEWQEFISPAEPYQRTCDRQS
jgi:WD40 repeat protein